MDRIVVGVDGSPRSLCTNRPVVLVPAPAMIGLLADAPTACVEAVPCGMDVLAGRRVVLSSGLLCLAACLRGRQSVLLA